MTLADRARRTEAPPGRLGPDVPVQVRMIASDLDGTLLGADGQLSDRTVGALRAARDAGIVVVAATGRAPTSSMPRLAPHDVVDHLVASNGSLIHDVATDTTTHRFPIDARHLAQLFAALDAAIDGLAYCWEHDDGYGWDPDFADIAAEHEDLQGHGPQARPNGDALVTKLMVRHDTLVRGELRDALLPHLPVPLNIGSSGVEFVEVTAVDVHKASALDHLAGTYGIEPTDVVAFGDNLNDIEMLTWAGRGIAVDNAQPAVRDVADHVIGHHADDAVAEFVERMLAGGSG